MKVRHCIVIVLCAVSLYGCFEFSEEVWINEDGSGRMKIDIGIGEALTKMVKEAGGMGPAEHLLQRFEEIKQQAAANPDITKVESDEYSFGAMHHVVFDLQVKDATVLTELNKKLMAHREGQPSKFEFTDSILEISKVEGGHFRFYQKFGDIHKKDGAETPGEAFSKLGEKFGKSVANSVLGDKYIQVKVNAPKIIESNGKVDTSLKSVEWRIPVLDIIGESAEAHELNAEIEMPFSKLLLSGLIAAGILLVIIVLVLLLRK